MSDVLSAENPHCPSLLLRLLLPSLRPPLLSLYLLFLVDLIHSYKVGCHLQADLSLPIHYLDLLIPLFLMSLPSSPGPSTPTPSRVFLLGFPLHLSIHTVIHPPLSFLSWGKRCGDQATCLAPSCSPDSCVLSSCTAERASCEHEDRPCSVSGTGSNNWPWYCEKVCEAGRMGEVEGREEDIAQPV